VKRFVIFASDQYYPDRRLERLPVEATQRSMKHAHAITPRDWWQIVDLETGRIVERNS